MTSSVVDVHVLGHMTVTWHRLPERTQTDDVITFAVGNSGDVEWLRVSVLFHLLLWFIQFHSINSQQKKCSSLSKTQCQMSCSSTRDLTVNVLFSVSSFYRTTLTMPWQYVCPFVRPSICRTLAFCRNDLSTTSTVFNFQVTDNQHSNWTKKLSSALAQEFTC